MCAQGAFSTMDPVVRDYWYVRVNEGMPVWHQKPAIALSLMGVPVAGGVALLLLARTIAEDRRADFANLGFLLVFSALLAALVFRTISVATLMAVPLVAIAIARLFARYRTEARPVRRVGMVAAMILLLMPGVVHRASRIAAVDASAAAEAAVGPAALRQSLPSKCESVESVAALAALRQGQYRRAVRHRAVRSC
jgi:hypothetical protein